MRNGQILRKIYLYKLTEDKIKNLTDSKTIKEM